MNDKQIIAGTVTSSSKSQTGRRRISVSFDFGEYEKDKKALFDEMFKELPVTVAVAVLSNDAAKEDMQMGVTNHHLYGKEAQILKQSSFFRTLEVWKAIGTDEDYLTWLRLQPCCICKNPESQAAHVRRIANGAGTGIKPEYSAIPLCSACHNKQHTEGESALGGKEYLDKLRIIYVQQWGWETLKKILGYEHWYDIPTSTLGYWAFEHNVNKFLPQVYQPG